MALTTIAYKRRGFCPVETNKHTFRMQVYPHVALAAAVCVCALSLVQGEYEPLRECSQSESCLYSYSVSQASSMSGTQSVLHVTSTVEVACDSVGNYGTKEAKKYCIRVTETSISSDNEMEGMEDVSSNAEELLSGPFCFVQTEDGKVVSVYHNPEESAQIVNFKKGIAAAFQANFKNTQVEVEEDTQSEHYSRYSYERIAPDHVIMHRVVDAESVIQFASKSLNGKPIKMERAEDVEYKQGKLLSSQGTTVVNLDGPISSSDVSRFESSDEDDLERSADTFDSTFGQGGLAGAGEYSLRLQSCSKKSRSFYRRSAEPQSPLASSNLHANVRRDAKEESKEEMSKLRKVVPSVRKALNALKEDLSDATTSNLVRKLLILESEHGPLQGFWPAVSDVMDYLDSEDDMEMRALLYSFLAADGSAKSQEMLLHAIRTAKDRKERNTLTVQLAFVRNVHPEILDEIENLVQSSNDTTDPLVLSYGALAASSPDLQRRIVKFLEERIRKEKINIPALIHLIHSLGNTESSLADKTLLQFTAHNDFGVRMAAVYALRYSIDSKDVQEALLKYLLSRQDGSLAEMLVRALIANIESKQHIFVTPIGDALFKAIMQQANNNTELRAMVYYYVNMLGPKAPKEWIGVLQKKLQKRGSTNWSDTSDSLYNLVADASTRKSDVSNYPTNKAYIWSKSFGVSDIKLDIAFGAFAGFGGSANPTSYKLFARGLASGYAYKYTATAFDALLLSENKPGASSISNKVYVTIVGKVLIDKSKEIPTCKDWTLSLYNSPDYTLLQVKSSVFIYVGTLDFTVTLSVKLSVAASLSACVNKCVKVKGDVTPSVTVTVTGGASATLAELVRGGIDVSGNFEYKVLPELSAGYQLYKGPSEFCFSLKHGWPNNKLSLYAYYQFRKIEICTKLGIPYPCGFSGWGDKNKWDAASKDWTLPSSSISTIWSSCDSAKLVCA